MTQSLGEPSWHVGYGSALLAFRKLAEAGVQAYVPMERYRVGNGSKRRSCYVPLFGNYFFVKLWPGQAWQPLLDVQGVQGFLGIAADDAPVAVDREFVAALMLHGPFDRETGKAIERSGKVILRQNETFRVVAGQYRGLFVQFRSLDKRGMANVLWKSKGRSYPLILKTEHLARKTGVLSPPRAEVETAGTRRRSVG